MKAKISYRDDARDFNVYELSGHTLLANGYLIDEKNAPVMYRDGPQPSPISPAKLRTVQDFRSRSESNVIELKEATWVCRPNSDNYYRWLLESLLKIYFFHTADWKIPIVIDRSLLSKKWVSETLKIFERDFFFVPQFSQIRTERLFFTDVDFKVFDPGKGSLKNFGKFLADRIADGNPSEQTPRRIHISRQRTKRKISNIDKVRRVFDKFGIVEIFLEDFNLAEQIQILKGAEFVVAPHGAGLANVIFMQSGGVVLELQHSRAFSQDDLFSNISARIGVNHSVMKCRRRFFADKDADLRVDPVLLEQKIEKLLGS